MNQSSSLPVADTLPRVLLVHADVLWLMQTGRELRERGLLVTECSEFDHALDWLAEVRADCVVVDGTMSGANGFELCRQLRADPRAAELPILMLTRLDSGESAQLSKEAGASEFCAHDIDSQVLIHRIRQMLWTALLERTVGHSQPRAKADASQVSGRFIWNSATASIAIEPNLRGLLDLPQEAAHIGLDELLQRTSSRDRRRIRARVGRLMAGGPSVQTEFELRSALSGYRRLRLSIEQVIAQDAGGFEVRGLLRDVTPSAGVQTRLYRLTHYDMLTGLPNRAWLFDQLRSNRLRQARGIALAVLDIDRFNEVAEAFGADVRDRLVVEVANRLRRLARASRPQWGTTARITSVAYLGGDDFALLLEDVADTSDAEMACRHVINVIAKACSIDDREFYLKTSVGVHVGETLTEDAADWIARAELARRLSAAAGGNRVMSFNASMSEEAAERLMLERDLHHAIARNELSIHLQPKFDARHGELVGFEALMRWQHLGKMQAPSRFIALAEESGLIESLGEWAIDQACAALAKLSQIGRDDCPISVNLSARQLRDGRLPRIIAAALGRHGVAASRLEVELTESALMENPDQALEELTAIRALGVGLAIDDFGTGHSSLAYLTRLPLTALKIDRSFVQNVDSVESARIVATAIIGLAENLQLHVIAEGVETEAQRDALIWLGCDIHQGFLYGRAIPVDEAIQCAARSIASATVEQGLLWPHS
jgi:diguanylate cyclase (GGDEF)-like protein